MTAFDLPVFEARAKQAHDWALQGAPDGGLPLSVREHFDHDVPALLAELQHLRVELAAARAQLAHRDYASEPGS